MRKPAVFYDNPDFRTASWANLVQNTQITRSAAPIQPADIFVIVKIYACFIDQKINGLSKMDFYFTGVYVQSRANEVLAVLHVCLI
jgi:hypothetical protein